MDIKDLINDSSLSAGDKDLWLEILEKLDDAQRKVLADFVNGQEENLNLLTENMKAKKAAFEAGDENALAEIIKQEQ